MRSLPQSRRSLVRLPLCSIYIFYLFARRLLILHRPPSIHFMAVDGAHKRSPSHCHRQFNILLVVKWFEVMRNKMGSQMRLKWKTRASATEMVAVADPKTMLALTRKNVTRARNVLSNGIQWRWRWRARLYYTQLRTTRNKIQIEENIIKISFALDGFAESCTNIFQISFSPSLLRMVRALMADCRCCHWL